MHVELLSRAWHFKKLLEAWHFKKLLDALTGKLDIKRLGPSILYNLVIDNIKYSTLSQYGARPLVKKGVVKKKKFSYFLAKTYTDGL